MIALRIALRRSEAFRAPFHASYVCRACFRAGECKCSLAGEAIEHSASFRVFRDRGVMRHLIEIKSGLLRAQQIERERQTVHLDLDFVTAHRP